MNTAQLLLIHNLMTEHIVTSTQMDKVGIKEKKVYLLIKNIKRNKECGEDLLLVLHQSI